ncbi:hypothetical protein SETIT_6G190800v2 [Setaria italica]|uniref:Uncharacterized protein n=1 Tax=Setaria italica TaxID=4555 RepID=A0A368RN59_SETIT|nr:hypothetical protein SETIT_6G190800v2 [Setaria italica]
MEGDGSVVWMEETGKGGGMDEAAWKEDSGDVLLPYSFQFPIKPSLQIELGC